jgi:hypothetical protein
MGCVFLGYLFLIPLSEGFPKGEVRRIYKTHSFIEYCLYVDGHSNKHVIDE